MKKQKVCEPKGCDIKKNVVSNKKSKTYMSQLSKTFKLKPNTSKYPYRRNMENESIIWHRQWLSWAESHGVTNSQEYEVTKYALDCIYECKRRREQLKGDKTNEHSKEYDVQS